MEKILALPGGREVQGHHQNNPLTYFHSVKLGFLEQRWDSQLTQFNFEIQYRPGKINPADALSRMPIKPSPEPLLTVVPPEVATVNDLQYEQLAVDPTPLLVSLATPWLLCCSCAAPGQGGRT